jgi:hypothetical protein
MDEIIIDEHGNEEVAADLVIRREGPLVVPAAVGVVGEDIRVRAGDLNDLDAVDALQKATAKKPKMTVDPKFVAMSRELRDRFLEEVELNPSLIALPAAKHDVTRRITERARPSFQLPAAMKALPKAA